MLYYLAERAGMSSLPPWGGSGLKLSTPSFFASASFGLPPWGGSGLKSICVGIFGLGLCLPPWGGSGLKYYIDVMNVTPN